MPVCDETQNLNDTNTKTFSNTKFNETESDTSKKSEKVLEPRSFETETSHSVPCPILQVLAAIGISFGASMVGGWLSFSSVAIPKMMNGTTADDPIQIDLFLGSWIASLFFIGNIVGCVAGGIVNQVAFSDTNS